MYILAALTHASVVVVFIYFLYTGYENGKHTEYLVPSANEYPGTCEEVYRPISGRFEADIHGLWSPVQAFRPSDSKYVLLTNNLEVSAQDFEQAITDIFNVFVADLSEKSYSRNLADNLVQWMSWKAVINTSSLIQTIYLTADPFNVLTSVKRGGGVDGMTGYIRGQDGTCNISTINLDTDKANALLTFRMDVNQYKGTAICTSLLNIMHFPIANTDQVQIAMDLRSFATAVAVRRI